MSSTLHLALAADKAFSVPLALCLYSLQKNVQEPARYCIHLLDGGIDKRELAPLELDIRYYDVGGILGKRFVSNGRLPAATYFRFLLPELLAPEIERVFFLDCDTLIRRDIAELWDCPLNGLPMAAPIWEVLGQSHREEYSAVLHSFPERVGLKDSETPYFYASMLLMDLPRMREERICQKLIELTEQTPPEKLLWNDQDALNIVLRGRIAPLPAHCNVIPLFAGEMQGESPANQAAYKDPSIIHFAATKPNVLTGPKYPWEAEFFHFWRKSPWRRKIPYPLVSTYGMGKCFKAIILAPIHLAISCPLFLKFYGSLLNYVRRLRPSHK